MHTAAKVMLSLGGVTTVIGIIMFVVGGMGMDFDPMDDNLYEGKSGTFNGDAEVWFGVYTEASCGSAEVSITNSTGAEVVTTGGFIDYCDEDEELGVNYLGGWYSSSSETYQINSSVTIAIADEGEYLEEAVGGFFAVLGSFGILACGGCFLLLGLIFALTMKSGDPQVIIQQQQQVPMMGATHMAAPQYQQPVQQQPVQQQPVQQQQPQEYQQPPQGGL